MKSGVKDSDTVTVNLEKMSEGLAPEDKLGHRPTSISIPIIFEEKTDFLEIPSAFKVICFDYKSDAFKEARKNNMPKGYEYIFVKNVQELNLQLASNDFQILLLNFDIATKGMNQISAEVKAKRPHTKVILFAKAIEPDKAKIHYKSPSGAAGYLQFPIAPERLETEFSRIHAVYRRDQSFKP